MKISKILLVAICAISILPAFGQVKTDKDKDLYDFVAPVIEAPKVDAKSDVVMKDEVKKEVQDTKAEKDAKDAKDASLVADAQSLIRDKLIQKYQIRLDDVIDRLGTKLGTVSADSERIALTNLRKTMSDRKALVLDRKDLDQTKRDIILAILDHVIYRVDGLIKQSATQTTGEQKMKA